MLVTGDKEQGDWVVRTLRWEWCEVWRYRRTLYIYGKVLCFRWGMRERQSERKRRVDAQVAARKRPRGHGAQASSSCPAPRSSLWLHHFSAGMMGGGKTFSLLVTRANLLWGNCRLLQNFFPIWNRGRRWCNVTLRRSVRWPIRRY